MKSLSRIIEGYRRALLAWLEDGDYKELEVSLRTLRKTKKLPKSLRRFAWVCQANLGNSPPSEHHALWVVVFGRLDRLLRQIMDQAVTQHEVTSEVSYLRDQLARWRENGHRFWDNILLTTAPRKDHQH